VSCLSKQTHLLPGAASAPVLLVGNALRAGRNVPSSRPATVATGDTDTREVRTIATVERSDVDVLPLTGERTVPGIAAENYWLRRHEAAYVFAQPLVAGQFVLEVGCGEGYGTALLASSARQVLGVDYDARTVAHAAARYPQVAFVRANLAALPVPSASVDVLATLQVIEHVWNHPEFVRECLRVLRPGGLLIVTTPNRLTFSPGLDAPVNPFHAREFTGVELSGLLGECGFDVDAVLGLHAAPRLRVLDREHDGFVAAQLATGPQHWSARLRDDVATVTVRDFLVVAADVHSVDESLDLVVLARRPF
jgi:SAM-dependent methyltransferase